MNQILLSGFDAGIWRHNHEDTVGKNSKYNEEWEEWMNQDENGHPTDGIERR